jgi:TolA-binding protein
MCGCGCALSWPRHPRSRRTCHEKRPKCRAAGRSEKRVSTEEQKRLDQLREQHKTLNEELMRERQERWSLQEQLNQEHGEHMEAERRAEQAEQEALRGATQQLREQMDRYIQDLEEDTRPGAMRRIK